MARSLDNRAEDAGRWDLVALGEVLLRLDPGEQRIHTARSFQAWEGGGEYNVARGLRSCFGMRTSLVTALADNPIGRLIESLILQSGVDTSHLHWVPYDGVGRAVRNALNFTERGFGVRAALGCSDRGHTATSQLKPGDIDWESIFGSEGARWFHTGGVFAALSESTSEVAREAMRCAHRHAAIVSYDLNYRPSLWSAIGGPARAREVNRELVGLADVLFGNEEDFSEALGFRVEGLDPDLSTLDPAAFGRMISEVVATYPALRIVATTLRAATTASRNDWGAVCWAGGDTFSATPRPGLEVFDRIGGGDSFVSGFVYAMLQGKGPEAAVAYGAAHGALAMTTPGDTSMATLADVERVMRARTARVVR